MILERFVCGRARSNAYLYTPEGGDALIVDAGVGAAPRILRRLREHDLRPRAVLLTHGHPDHVWTAGRLASELDVPVYLHPGDWCWLEDCATGGYVPLVTLGGRILARLVRLRPPGLRPLDDFDAPGLDVRHTPGHTAGSVLFRADGLCFTGDTVFSTAPGHTGYPGGRKTDLTESIAREVLPLPDETRLLPGHGPDTVLERVRPVLERFVGRS